MRLVKKMLLLWLLLALSLACNFPVISLSSRLATPVPTLAPTLTLPPSPTLTLIPPPTPTPIPAIRVSLGDRAILEGDWGRAFDEYQTALAASEEPDVRAAARLGVGQSKHLAGDYQGAQDTLLNLIAEQPESPRLAEVYFTLGQNYMAQERYLEAAEAYAQYLSLRPGVIDSAVQDLRGDALFAAGDYAGAIAAYQAALGAPHLPGDLNLETKIARAYDLSGDYATAAVAYQDIYTQTSDDYTKAQMDLLLGQAYTALGDLEKAQAAYMDAVMNYPASYDTYLALVNLVDAGVTVDNLQRGLVDYYAGQYGVAVAAFDRYLQENPADPATALYYQGLAQRALGGNQEALLAWEQVIQSYPDSQWWDEAWEQKAYTQWSFMDQYGQAGQTLLDFVTAVPTHPRAGEFLFDAAGVAERAVKLDRAAKLWERVSTEFPEDERASRALFLAGITRFRLADYLAAHDLFQRLLALQIAPHERAAAFLWSGKAKLAIGEQQAARTDWLQAAALDPTGYYSERAGDLLDGLAPFSPPQEYDFSFDVQSERQEAEDWMRTVFDLPPETDLSSPGPLADDQRFQRGNELWQLGLHDQARAEFEDLRQSSEADPAANYRLANHLVELGAYRTGILAARRVLTLAGLDDAATLSAPIYFNHLRFGPYFRDLIISAAQEYDFHPLFLLSLVRQESLFDSFISSSSDARGLMQIIPATGAEVASNAGWPPDYTADDLFRPLVSITLGTDYLHRQRAFLGGDIYATLAAYNGGPGKAAAWKELVPPDPDLLLEVIRFEETRNYIRGIYENFDIYRKIYDRTQ